MLVVNLMCKQLFVSEGAPANCQAKKRAQRYKKLLAGAMEFLKD